MLRRGYACRVDKNMTDRREVPMESTLLNRRSFALLGAAALAAPALHAQGRPEKSKIAIAVGGKAAFYYLPLTISEQLGYFKAEGLDVEISDFAGGSKALQALMGGSADVVSGAYEHTINMQARNQFIQSIVLMGRAPQIALGVSTKAMPRYRGLADLRGKKIGVSAPARPPTWWPTSCSPAPGSRRAR